MSFERHGDNSKIDLVDTHQTKIGQNAPSCRVKITQSFGHSAPPGDQFMYQNKLLFLSI